jgi:outer membrane protein TolC
MRAQLTMDVAQAYWNATLSDRLLEIAETTLALAERTLEQVRLEHQLGEEAEFEVLRARVTRDTQRPVVIQRIAERDLAHSTLRQALGLPLDAPLELSTPLEEAEFAALPTLCRSSRKPSWCACRRRSSTSRARSAGPRSSSPRR